MLPKPATTQLWPITPQAWSALLAEIERIEADLAGVTTDGIVRLPTGDVTRRLRTLTALRDRGAVAERGVAAVGRRVTIREEDGETESYAICLPGDGDPANGWISADSPLGAAVLGSTPGSTVRVFAPMGTREVLVVGVGDD